jgi:hypothetical protein
MNKRGTTYYKKNERGTTEKTIQKAYNPYFKVCCTCCTFFFKFLNFLGLYYYVCACVFIIYNFYRIKGTTGTTLCENRPLNLFKAIYFVVPLMRKKVQQPYNNRTTD